MLLTHAQAREMIQFDADSALEADSLPILKSHLASCEACRLYADSIHTMEVHLRRAMRTRWNILPAPLVIGAIKKAKSTQFTQVATRFVVVASVIWMFAAVALGIARGTQGDENPGALLAVPLIPTPSMQITSTMTRICGQIPYRVQPNDTLESIAHQFSIPKKELIAANKMSSEIVIPGTEIIIPLCNSTPTGTVHPPAITTTINPSLETLSQTPDG
jgi:hypothetical protein